MPQTKIDPLEVVVRDYSFNVAQALGLQGKPRGDVYFGVELELDVDGMEDWDDDYDERPEEPRLEDAFARCCDHYWDFGSGPKCPACKKVQKESHERDMRIYRDELAEYKRRYKDKIDPKSVIAWPLQTMPRFVLLKEDSTVEGVEIVSAPASLKIHRTRWAKFFDGLPPQFKAHDNCGLHIHLTRNVLNVDQQWAINEFINADHNESWMLDIAGRDFIDHDSCAKTRKTREEMRKAFDEHHEAVSVSKKNTLEVRIFASTTHYKTFMTRLEFVAALVHYVQEGKWTDQTLCPRALVDFLKPRTLTYPYLWEYMNVR